MRLISFSKIDRWGNLLNEGFPTAWKELCHRLLALLMWIEGKLQTGISGSFANSTIAVWFCRTVPDKYRKPTGNWERLTKAKMEMDRSWSSQTRRFSFSSSMTSLNTSVCGVFFNYLYEASSHPKLFPWVCAGSSQNFWMNLDFFKGI